MNHNVIELAQKAGKKWWNSYSERETTSGIQRKTRGEFTQENARTALVMYKSAIDAGIDSQFLRDFPRKCGYGIVGGNDGIKIGLKSTKITPDSKIVKDHVFGATLAGKVFFEEFEKWNYDIDYMVNTWLPNNIFIFAVIEIEKEEHNKLGTDATVSEKRQLEHYAAAGIELTYEPVKFRSFKNMTKGSEKVVNTFFNFKNTK